MKITNYLITALFITVMTAGPSYSQGLSLYTSLGYGLGRGGTEWCSSSVYNNSYDLTSVDNQYLSIGKGIKIEGGIQVNISENAGLRVGAGYSGMLPVLEDKDDYAYQMEPDIDKYKASLLQVQCIAVFKHTTANIRPYAGVGGGLVLADMSREGIYYITYWNGDIKMEDKVEYRFKPALGLIGILGFEAPVTQGLSFFAELNLQQVAFRIKEYEVVEYYVDGDDTLDNVDVDDGQAGNQTIKVFEEDNPAEETPWVVQGSNAGIRFGFIISIL